MLCCQSLWQADSLAKLGNKFQSEDHIKTFKTKVYAAAVVLPNVESGIISTRPSKNVVAYSSFNKDGLPAIITKSWIDVGLDAGAIPEMADYISNAIWDKP